MKNDGKSAFPFTPVDRTGPIASTQPGMSLRDYFAAKAMQGDWAAQNEYTGSFGSGCGFGDSAKRYYAMADAMIAERDK